MAPDDHIRRLERQAQLGRLGAGIGHEARNVLTGVLGFAQLASGRVDDPTEMRVLLQLIERETTRALEILSGFLAVGRVAAPTAQVEVNEVAHDAARVVRHAFRLRDIGIRVELAADAGIVVGDRGALRQVVLNLAFNAAQAMTAGGEVRMITCLEADAVVLRVVDDGPGVPAEMRDDIFRPFFTTRADGTGLGLAISAAIVAEHGGVLTLEPTERGASFAMRLPRTDGRPR